MTRTALVAAALASAALASAACGRDDPRPLAPSAAAARPSAPEPVRAALALTIAHGMRGDAARYLPVPPESVRVAIERSGVVPGLRYHWGTYVPPGADDVAFHSVVATSGDRLQAIRNAHEWSVAAGFAQWSPATAGQAVAACAEAGRASAPHPTRAIGVYAGGEPVAAVTAEARKVRTPQARQVAPQRWEVIVWMREPGATVRERCLFTPRTGRSGPLAEFARTDSVAAAPPVQPPA